MIVERLWPGATIACIATGPSLIEADVSWCRGKMPVIAVNDAFRLAPWADVLYAGDAKWWGAHHGVPGFAGLKFSVQAEPKEDEKKTALAFGAWPDIQILRNTGVQGLESDPSGLRTGKNSGAQALGLAVHLGAARIVLLGYDMGHPKGRRSHFFGKHAAPLQDGNYGSYIPYFEAMVPSLQDRGIRVVNASRETALACFPRVTLEEALA